MKKLLIAMTAVSALSVFAENPFSATAENFESQEVGPFVISDVPGAYYWAMADYDAAADDVGEVKEEDGNKFLAVETSSKTLYRTLKEVNEQEIVDTAEIGDGLVFDTLVKFTCRDTLDVPPLDDGAKIAIWAGYDGDEEEPSTNLYITAAAVNAGYELPAANFLLDADVDFSAWHRVTIRADKDVSTDDKEKLIGFKVWIDEEQVVADETDYDGKIDSSVLSESAKKDLAARKLFIGLEKAGELAALGFNGQGSVDNIGAFDNANAPEFAKVAEGFTLTWDAEAISALAVNGEDVLDIEAESFFVPAGAEAIVATITFNEGYEGDATQNFKFADKTGKIDATFAAVKIGDKAYATIADAIAAAQSGDTIKLNVNINETVSSMYTIAETDITFDLNGKAWTIEQGDQVVFYTEDSKIAVIDSLGGGVMTVTTEQEETLGIFYAEGTGVITIGSDADNGVTINGLLADELGADNFVIARGKFDAANNSDGDAFKFAANVVDGGKVEQVGDFWAVNMGDIPPEPTKWDVTFSTNNVAVAEYNTKVVDGQTLAPEAIPTFEGGSWDVDPTIAVITCATNFNYTIKAEESWDIPEEDEDKPASEVWSSVPQKLADVPAGKLSTWAKANNVAFGGPINVDAYLLNCAPTPEAIADAEKQINIASIEFVEGEWVIKTVGGGEEGATVGNGVLELVDVTESIVGKDATATKLWKMQLVPATATK